MNQPRHFLDLDRLDGDLLGQLLERAAAYKRDRAALRATPGAGHGRTLAMLFEKPSTRTRVSFEVAMNELGGRALTLDRQGTQMGRGESLADTARVLSRYADVALLRTGSHAQLEEFAGHAGIPVINGLTDRSHPCQVMADLLTLMDRFGSLDGRHVAWIGDGNNVANSWIHAAMQLGIQLRIACPPSRHPPADLMGRAVASGHVRMVDDAAAAARGASAVLTDTWKSMAAEQAVDGTANWRELFLPFQVNRSLMDVAAPEAVFMHCLPAYRGEEVTAEVIDGPHSAVWDEAENRLHVQKAILEWCLADR